MPTTQTAIIFKADLRNALRALQQQARSEAKLMEDEFSGELYPLMRYYKGYDAAIKAMAIMFGVGD